MYRKGFLWIGAALFGVVQTRDWQFPHAVAQQPLGRVSDDDVDILYGSQFNGLNTYARVPYVNCFLDEAVDGVKYDIAILARHLILPLRQDQELATALAELGRAARGSMPISPGVSIRNALKSWATIVDCGDVPLTVLDNNYALAQLTKGHKVVSGRKAANQSVSSTPRIITLGGDHTTTLPALRSVYKHWGKASVIHFDSHLDTWEPSVLGGGISDYAGLNHGTFLHIAHEEGLIRNTSIHAGIRAPLAQPKGDIQNDERCGFARITARDLDRIGVSGITSRIRERVAAGPVYISVDIDVLDPAFAPGT
ncbi:hypothetical protein NPX13_g8473 [Xylaria arbuscula]|uniref:Uncharacterized protein n=1 Tax=Xylaria arbuscula TaxID=114810 RepID=A0A9W8N8W1_9PEZI|nr:hypothetical protein NPX13_g8473 [Xylaria arbuscula]